MYLELNRQQKGRIVMKNMTKNRKTQFVPKPSVNTPANPFVKTMQVASNYTLTENAALTNKSTLNYVLDWFGAGGALRQPLRRRLPGERGQQ